MLEIFPVYMTSFQQDRLIRVYLPYNYDKESKYYPVIYMHDGQNVFQDVDAIGGHSLKLEEYLNTHQLEVIVVGIDQNSEDRVNEYCPWKCGEYSKKILGKESFDGGRGSEYVDFIVNELKPFIDNKYRTLRDSTAIAGISLGGLISTYAMCRYPQIFKHVTVISSAFYRNQEEIEKLVQESDLSLVENFYLDCGTKESGNEEIDKEFIASNTAIYERLKLKIPNARFQIIDRAEHQYIFFKERISELFRFVNGGQ